MTCSLPASRATRPAFESEVYTPSIQSRGTSHRTAISLKSHPPAPAANFCEASLITSKASRRRTAWVTGGTDRALRSAWMFCTP